MSYLDLPEMDDDLNMYCVICGEMLTDEEEDFGMCEDCLYEAMMNDE